MPEVRHEDIGTDQMEERHDEAQVIQRLLLRGLQSQIFWRQSCRIAGEQPRQIQWQQRDEQAEEEKVQLRHSERKCQYSWVRYRLETPFALEASVCAAACPQKSTSKRRSRGSSLKVRNFEADWKSRVNH